jgi:RNA polymerase II subunit A-like phosphatase
MSKTLRLGPRLRYPITIVNLLKQPGDAVKKQQPLFRYSYKWMKEVGDAIRDDTWEEEQTSIATFDSPTEGDLKQWLIKEGQVIRADCPGLVVKEACGHEIQFQGMCGICGKDMTEVSWASETRDTDRAPISMVHDQTSLTVSKTQAQRTESELQKRLLQSRKLTLVVDLDQTIIHACIDPTVGEWQKDPTNPNYESVKHVKAFQLNDGPRGVAHQCWYYIKMRPRLEEFLRRIASMYELHVYTMGTRAYAEGVARIVDPERKLFGNRVISRDENGNMFAKSLQRLFPVSTNMVVIIDDRADVWPKNRSNLIKVSPYDFFRGIGDINSSFLPKRQDIITPAADVPAVNGNGAPPAGGKKEKGDEAAAPAEGDLAVTQLQVEEQERALEKQMMDRPLQLLQLKQDKEDEEAEKATTQSEHSQDAPPSSQPQTRHQVLRDDDDELEYLEQHLTRLHKVYFEEHDRELQDIAATDDFQLPDVGRTLSTLKRRAMRGVTVALTGMIPNGVAVEDTEIGQQLRSFGAAVASRITRDVTHLVVNTLRPMTDKWRQARRIPSIKIVNQDWLAACFSQWATVDETPYLFSVVTNGAPAPVVEEASEPDVVSDSDSDAPPKGIKRLRLKAPTLKLVGVGGDTQELDGEESDDEDDGEDELEAEFNNLAPDALEDGQLSPIDGLKSFNWGSVDEELDEFLASGSDDDDDDDDDDEEEDEDEGMADADGPAATRKRKFDADEDKEEGGTDSEVPSSQETAGSRSGRTSQAKRLRRTKSARGTSSLRNQYVSDVDGEDAGKQKKSSLPTPQVTGDEDGGELNGLDAEMEAEMEAELMAEFEAAPGIMVEEKG